MAVRTVSRRQLALKAAVLVAQTLLMRQMGRTVKAGFDPSQARDGQGQWSETGAGGGIGLPNRIGPNGRNRGELKPLDANDVFHTGYVKAADRLGVPHDTVVISKEKVTSPYKDGEAAVLGEYDKATGKVILYRANLTTQDEINATLAHENIHRLFVNNGVQKVIDAFQAKYHVKPFALLGQHPGVSSYGIWHWLNSGFVTAVEENIAEVARLKADGLYDTVPEVWRVAYEAVIG